ncbi:MAG: hypothetical protein Q9160_000357 [Pyrenula sp. 1 TL-2023]
MPSLLETLRSPARTAYPTKTSDDYASEPLDPNGTKSESSSSSSPHLPSTYFSSQRAKADKKNHTTTKLILSNLSTFVFTTLLILLGITIRQHAFPSSSGSSGSVSHPIVKSPCGTTAESARAASCHFDPISFSWLPDACYDADLSAAFLELGNATPVTNWNYYPPINSTTTKSPSLVPADRDAVLAGEYPFLFVSWEYHLYHCTFMWRKLHRAILSGRPIDSYIGGMGHTGHCERMLMEGIGALPDETGRHGIKLMEQVGGTRMRLNTTNTIISSKWPDCGTERVPVLPKKIGGELVEGVEDI